VTNAPGITHWLPLPYGAFGEMVRDPLGFHLRRHPPAATGFASRRYNVRE
jgi:hypothetical protein